MAISLIEADEEVAGNLSQFEKDLREGIALTAQNDAPEPDKQQAPEKKARVIEVNDDELPENLRGKDIKDLVRMLQESQSTIGRMANDLGTQRKLTDRLLDLKRESDLSGNRSRPEPVTVDSNELLENPTQAIERVATARVSAATKELQDEIALIRAQQSAQSFVAHHPDYQQYVGNEEFVSWARATPYRSSRADAAMSGDYGAADELLTEFKDRLSYRKAKEEPKPDANLEKAKAAGLERGTSAGSRSSSKKTYRRVELLQLQMSNPELYYDDATQKEIMLAYAEGRVK